MNPLSMRLGLLKDTITFIEKSINVLLYEKINASQTIPSATFYIIALKHNNTFRNNLFPFLFISNCAYKYTKAKTFQGIYSPIMRISMLSSQQHLLPVSMLVNMLMLKMGLSCGNNIFKKSIQFFYYFASNSKIFMINIPLLFFAKLIHSF